MRVGSSFEVGDYEFTKFSMIPSVALMNEIPGDIASSWYDGNVFVSLKDAAFEPSSPMRHMAELYSLLSSQRDQKRVLLLYTDGGPDHRVTYVSVQLALIAIFKLLDLDFLCAVRTAPCHSWRNPVERIMSTVNFGLQCVGLMWEKMDDSFESEVSKCKSLKELREAAKRRSGFQEEAIDSVSHVKVLLTQIFERLQLKGKKFTIFSAASPQSIEEMWKELQSVDSSSLLVKT